MLKKKLSNDWASEVDRLFAAKSRYDVSFLDDAGREYYAVRGVTALSKREALNVALQELQTTAFALCPSFCAWRVRKTFAPAKGVLPPGPSRFPKSRVATVGSDATSFRYN